MSSVLIVSVIFALVVLLVGYAFVYQALEKRRKRRQRLVTALKHRQRNFESMASGFPSGFLTKDLTLIIHRALLDSCEQLSRLEPKDPTHGEAYSYFSRELESIKQQPQAQRSRLENPKQEGEIKQLLQELYRFIAHQTERGNLAKAQGHAYLEQIKRLTLQAAVDINAASARQAQAAGKPRLAVHYYNLARKSLLRESGGPDHQKQLSEFSNVVAKLERQLAQDPGAEHEPGPAAEEQKEWDLFSEEASDGWKKKQLYD